MKNLINYFFEDFAVNSLIYIAVALPFFLFFWKYYKDRFQKRRIQERKRSTNEIVRFEIKNSCITLLILAFIDVLIYVAKNKGITQLYKNIDDYGWAYLFFSIALLILFHDTWFYFTHRLMHHPKLFKHIHKIHHISTDPSPFASMSFHPFEALIEAGAYVVVSFLFPVHILALFIWQIFQIVMNVIGHLGYEIFPKGANKQLFLKWLTPSTHHNMHHAKFNGNYGLYFTWWDRIFKTEFKDYHQTFEKVQERILYSSDTTPKKSSKLKILGYILFSISIISFLCFLIIPISTLSLLTKANLAGSLFLVGEITFWTSIAILGKEFWRQVKNRIKELFTKKNAPDK